MSWRGRNPQKSANTRAHFTFIKHSTASTLLHTANDNRELGGLYRSFRCICIWVLIEITVSLILEQFPQLLLKCFDSNLVRGSWSPISLIGMWAKSVNQVQDPSHWGLMELSGWFKCTVHSWHGGTTMRKMATLYHGTTIKTRKSPQRGLYQSLESFTQANRNSIFQLKKKAYKLVRALFHCRRRELSFTTKIITA